MISNLSKIETCGNEKYSLQFFSGTAKKQSNYIANTKVKKSESSLRTYFLKNVKLIFFFSWSKSTYNA